ncbi:MAG: hypothetical protein ACRCVU_06970 [Flavobacterium sp.]
MKKTDALLPVGLALTTIGLLSNNTSKILSYTLLILGIAIMFYNLYLKLKVKN